MGGTTGRQDIISGSQTLTGNSGLNMGGHAAVYADQQQAAQKQAAWPTGWRH